ncbi:MAG: pentapeptide repeat-containing protein [Spirirestis rafaelensis WJT71-NPBG6]|jgi:hypothetical protein|nr:pentapeptide repeat-containing protein [Spirirestis rafaelensis WJT71-NPBG6]
MLNTKFINTNLNNTNLLNAITWDETEMENNYIIMSGEDEFGQLTDNLISNKTDFSGASLNNANLRYTNFKAATNLTRQQLETAKNWDNAIYNNELFNKLGLPKSLQSIIFSMSRDMNDDVNVENLIGYQVEVRNYINHETKTIIKGEITGFCRYNTYVNVKTSNGEQLDKLPLDEVYVYQNQ